MIITILETKDENDEVIPLADIPPPPDGGWGWVVVFAGFMCNLIYDGIVYTFGLVLEPLVISYDTNKGTISWAVSIMTGVSALVGKHLKKSSTILFIFEKISLFEKQINFIILLLFECIRFRSLGAYFFLNS